MPLITNHNIDGQHIIIVDPSIGDYAGLADRTHARKLRITLTTTGTDALKLLPSHCDVEWLICVELPDMTGLELLHMLHATDPEISVQLVTDQFDIDHELKAYQLGATRYRTKPIGPPWENY